MGKSGSDAPSRATAWSLSAMTQELWKSQVCSCRAAEGEVENIVGLRRSPHLPCHGQPTQAVPAAGVSRLWMGWKCLVSQRAKMMLGRRKKEQHPMLKLAAFCKKRVCGSPLGCAGRGSPQGLGGVGSLAVAVPSGVGESGLLQTSKAIWDTAWFAS